MLAPTFQLILCARLKKFNALLILASIFSDFTTSESTHFSLDWRQASMCQLWRILNHTDFSWAASRHSILLSTVSSTSCVGFDRQVSKKRIRLSSLLLTSKLVLRRAFQANAWPQKGRHIELLLVSGVVETLVGRKPLQFTDELLIWCANTTFIPRRLDRSRNTVNASNRCEWPAIKMRLLYLTL